MTASRRWFGRTRRRDSDTFRSSRRCGGGGGVKARGRGSAAEGRASRCPKSVCHRAHVFPWHRRQATRRPANGVQSLSPPLIDRQFRSHWLVQQWRSPVNAFSRFSGQTNSATSVYVCVCVCG